MRAKASIPAWAKQPLVWLGAAAIVLLLSAPLFQPSVDRQCAPLLEQVEAVRTGVAGARVSDTWETRGRREKYGWRMMSVVVERGDFRARYSRLSTRACLGPDWIESRDETLQPGWVIEAWRYERPDWPIVVFREGVNQGRQRQIEIQARPR